MRVKGNVTYMTMFAIYVKSGSVDDKHVFNMTFSAKESIHYIQSIAFSVYMWSLLIHFLHLIVKDKNIEMGKLNLICKNECIQCFKLTKLLKGDNSNNSFCSKAQ